MKRGRRGCSAAMALVLVTACSQSPDDALSSLSKSPTAVAREARLEKALASEDSSGEGEAPLARWILPTSLNEISGLVITSDGRLLVHGDEAADIWQVDYRRGMLVKRFAIGPTAVKGDFEAITMVNDAIWLLESNGKLYEFKEGPADAHVDFKKYDTGLKKLCEFEGLAYDARIKSLLLACKNIKERSERSNIIIYRWSLAPDSAGRLSRLVVPVASVREGNSWAQLQVSDLTIDPATGNYVVLASKERAIVVITPDGQPVSTRVLPESHQQPEGIAITKGMVLVSDEASRGPATITMYRWP